MGLVAGTEVDHRVALADQEPEDFPKPDGDIVVFQRRRGSERVGTVEDRRETSLQAAERAGFRMVDIRVTLELKPIRLPPAVNTLVRTRFANMVDVPDLRRIAAASHHDSRFYSDHRFPRERCHALYETWIENAVHNPADAVIVLDDGDRVTGYCSCHLREGSVGNIGLLALADEVQGLGFGGSLLHAALLWFQGRQCEGVTVVTQARNIRALRFYQKAGFLTRSVEVWFHRWFTN